MVVGGEFGAWMSWEECSWIEESVGVSRVERRGTRTVHSKLTALSRTRAGLTISFTQIVSPASSKYNSREDWTHTRNHPQPTKLPFVHFFRSLDARRVGSFNERLADDVDDKFFGGEDVFASVFRAAGREGEGDA